MPVNHLTQDFCGGVFVKGKETLLVCSEHGYDRIIFMQQKIMIKMLIYKRFNAVSNIGKVADHALVVELFLLYGN